MFKQNIIKFIFLVICTIVINSKRADSSNLNEQDNGLDFTVVEVGGDYIIVNVTGPNRFNESNLGGIRVVYELEREVNGTSAWFASHKKELLYSQKDEQTFQHQYKLSHLQSHVHYRIYATAFYGISNLTTSNKPIDVTTTQLTRLNVSKKPLSIHFEAPNAVKYFIQVEKIKRSPAEPDCVLNVTMSACFIDKSLTLNDLTKGESYLIKVWHTDTDGNVSAPQTTNYEA